jgi:pilus assembly protein Flp/PilA
MSLTTARLRDDRGATAVEYGLIIAGVAAVILVSVSVVGTRIGAGMQSAAVTLAAASQSADAAALIEAGPPAGPEAAGAGGTSNDVVPPGDAGTGSTAGSSTTAAAAAGAPRVTTMNAADWSVLSGQALINGSTVQTTRAANVTWQNTSVMNSTPWTNPDITLTSTMRLILPDGVSGFGYGVWLRATPNASTRTVPSGYSFQVDPGVGNRFVLKVWENGTETTMAMSSFPGGFDPKVDNAISVTMVGDTFVALVNGAEVLRVNSLSDLARVKGKAVPTGTQFGLRAWQKADATMSGTTVAVPPA